MIPEHRTPTPPGEALDEEFLGPLGLTQTALARHPGVHVRRINEIVQGERAVSQETAHLLAAALGTSPEFWMNAQSSHDVAMHGIDVEIEPLVKAS